MRRSIRTKTTKIVTMVMVTNEWPLHALEVAVAIQATAANHVEIRAIVVNPHPLNRLHEHDSDDISDHWRAYTFCYSLTKVKRQTNKMVLI